MHVVLQTGKHYIKSWSYIANPTVQCHKLVLNTIVPLVRLPCASVPSFPVFS